MLRETKPRNARTARIVKAREPQIVEDRKKVLLLHGTKFGLPLQSVLRTIASLTKPHSILLHKKNENIHPFDNAASLEFLAGKNESGVVLFASHSKKRPHTITLLRTFDNKALDLVELLLINANSEKDFEPKLQVPVEMKPLILFAGSQWDDASSSLQASLFRTLKSTFLDLFSGREVFSADVAGLQYLVIIATGELPSEGVIQSSQTTISPNQLPVIHLRWYKLRTLRSSNPKKPRVEVDSIGPCFDFRIGRYREADESMMKDALKKAKPPNEPRAKKNVETDLVGDKLGRVHLGRQDLSTLQTRKMKGLKRAREETETDAMEGLTNGHTVSADEEADDISVDEHYGQENVLGDAELEEGGAELNGDQDDNDEEGVESLEFIDENVGNNEPGIMPKRQRTS